LKDEKQQQREEAREKRYLNALKKVYKATRPHRTARIKLVEGFRKKMLEYEVIWGHIGILVVAVRRLSRWKVKTRLAGPSPTSPMKAEITISPISNRKGALL